jgi:hypothetical protein
MWREVTDAPDALGGGGTEDDGHHAAGAAAARAGEDVVLEGPPEEPRPRGWGGGTRPYASHWASCA